MSKQIEDDQNFNEAPTTGLSVEEDKLLADLLSKWTGGRISGPVFTRLAKIVPQPSVEVVIFRINNGVLETLLVPRPEGDIVWAGMLHTPGSIIRAADFDREDKNPLNGAFERIQKNETGSKFISDPVFAGRIYRKVARGPEIVDVYIAKVPGDMSLLKGQVWFAVDKLKDNPDFIQTQLEHVNMAAKKYGKGI